MIRVGAQPGIALRIQARHAVEIDRRSVRINDPRPRYLHAVLTIRDMRVVPADEARPLRDQKIHASGGVVHILSNQRLDLTGQIGIQALLEYRRTLPSGLDLEPAESRL